MGTVVKVALGILLALVLLIVGCAAIIGIGAGLEQPGGGDDTGLEDSGGGGGGGDASKRSPQKTRRFSGNGSKNIGTIKVTDDAVLTFRNPGDEIGGSLFIVTDQDFKINVNSQGKRGSSVLEPGTYRKVDVTANGDWTMTIKAR